VDDNGIGVPAEQRERIFGLFQRLHRSSEYSGTGVGLAIVRRAVQRMGGQVGVESESGGSRFWVELRKTAAAEPQLNGNGETHGHDLADETKQPVQQAS